jgi:hypothetical protein
MTTSALMIKISTFGPHSLDSFERQMPRVTVELPTTLLAWPRDRGFVDVARRAPGRALSTDEVVLSRSPPRDTDAPPATWVHPTSHI